MSKDTILAEAINLPQSPATVLLPVSYLQTIADEVRRLRGELNSLDQDLKRFKVFTKTGEVDDLKERIQELEEAVAKLIGQKRPGQMQKNRADVLRAILVANGGKMFESDARKKMGIDKATFSRLLATMEDLVEVRPFHANKRRNLLILRSAKG